MALSPNLSVIRVTGSYVDVVGAPATGTVTFTLSTVLVDRTFNQIILPTPVSVTLVGGAFAVDLPATDDPDLTPTNVYYSVREVIAGQQRTYTIVLPFGGGPVDLADVVPVTVGPNPVYALLRLDALSDVTVAGVSDGNTLVYQAGTGKWVPGSGGGGGGGGVAASTVSNATTFGIAPVIGTSTTYARGDHQHGTPALGTTASTAAAGNHGHTNYSLTSHTHAVADVTNLTTLLAGKVDTSVLAAKGDLLAATATGVVGRVAVGTNGQHLVADSTQATGLRWTNDTGGTVPFTRAGALIVGAGQGRIYNNGPFVWTIRGASASVATAPVGSSVIVDVNMNGTTIFGTQSARPTILAGTNNSGFTTGMTVTTVPVGGFLTVDIDQIGSGGAGADLVVQVEIG